jgi:GMP synthase PP-ATPase subunit
MRLIAVDAKEDFLTDLAGVEDPERKRKLIGARFVRVFEARRRGWRANGAWRRRRFWRRARSTPT